MPSGNFRLLAAGVVLIVACGRTAKPVASAAATPEGALVTGTSSTVDGITTIEFPTDAFDHAAAFVLDTAPVAVMGGPGGRVDFDLTHARSALILPNGYASLVSIGGGHLMTFDSTGKPLRTFGKLGKGPGEFMRPDGPLLLGGDTLLIPDDGNRRFNYFSAEHGLITTVAIIAPTREAFMLTTPMGRIGGNRLAWYSNYLPEGDTMRSTRPSSPIGISSLTRDSMRIIDSVPGFELTPIMTHYRNRDRISVVQLRLGQRAYSALWDTTIAIATGVDGYVIDRKNTAGHLVQRIRVPMARRPVTQAMREAQIALEMARLCPTCGEGLVDPEETKRQARENPFADSLPPYSRILAAPGNVLWVVDAIAPSDTAWSATAFRNDGAIMGRLHVGGKGTPLTFGTDRVIIRSTDEDGVVSFKVYRFRLGS